MTSDEQAIRDLVSKWMSDSQAGDVDAVLSLMSDDVLFSVPGKEPFGKEAFAAASRGSKGVRVEGTSDIQEIKVLGDWAWMRNKLHVKITPPGGTTIERRGYTLTILRKDAGKWLLIRDANLML
ncbi:MAG TPA: SgcJ/EcaC family oxidoreductase [Phycisphaerae bacterium]